MAATADIEWAHALPKHDVEYLTKLIDEDLVRIAMNAAMSSGRLGSPSGDWHLMKACAAEILRRLAAKE